MPKQFFEQPSPSPAPALPGSGPQPPTSAEDQAILDAANEAARQIREGTYVNPLNVNKLPGYSTIFLSIFHAFLPNVDPSTVTDQTAQNIIEASHRLTEKLVLDQTVGAFLVETFGRGQPPPMFVND